MSISRYWKFVVAVVGALLGWGTLVVTSPASAISSAEWLSLGFSLATALGVYSVPNSKEK